MHSTQYLVVIMYLFTYLHYHIFYQYFRVSFFYLYIKKGNCKTASGRSVKRFPEEGVAVTGDVSSMPVIATEDVPVGQGVEAEDGSSDDPDSR